MHLYLFKRGYPPNEEKVEEEEVCEIISDDDEEIQALDRCFKCKMKSGLYFMSNEFECLLTTHSIKPKFY